MNKSAEEQEFLVNTLINEKRHDEDLKRQIAKEKEELKLEKKKKFWRVAGNVTFIKPAYKRLTKLIDKITPENKNEDN